MRNILLLIAALGLLFFVSDSSNHKLQLGSQAFSIEIADTEPLRQKGLSGRNAMPIDHGMLFVFSDSAIHCFWMKDMNFAIDIVWVDESKTVVDIEPNVTPETYPQKFCSNTPAKYVLEINANRATELGITPGATLRY